MRAMVKIAFCLSPTSITAATAGHTRRRSEKNEALHYYVDVRADFPRPASIAEPTGAELAAILADGLPKHGVQATKSECVDFAHYVECSMGASAIELMVGAEYLDETDNRWYIQPCPRTHFLRSSSRDLF